MMIQKIKLHNFRGFQDIEVNFHPNLTVLVGKNGTGKTSVLEATAISAGSLFNSFDNVVNYGIKKADAHYKYYNMGSSIDVQSQFPVDIYAEGTVGGNNINWMRSLNSENGRTVVTNAKDITTISSEYQERLRNGDTTLILPIIAYYGTGRLWDQHREKKSDVLKKNTRTNGYLDSLDGTANVKLMLKWFQKMAINDSQNSTKSPEFTAVREAMEKCFASITGSTDVKILYNLDTLEIDVIYTENGSKRVRMPINQLSDGYRCALSLIADIAYRMAILNPQLLGNILTETDGIVLIDEIDLHLHPAWQQRILADLQSIFPKVQFIVTTHAPAVINSVQSDNLVILEQGQANEPNGEVYGKDVNTIIEGVMGAYTRPPYVKELFYDFYHALDNKNFDNADKILSMLEEKIGQDDSELAACRVKLKLKKIRGGSNA